MNRAKERAETSRLRVRRSPRTEPDGMHRRMRVADARTGARRARQKPRPHFAATAAAAATAAVRADAALARVLPHLQETALAMMNVL
ncbi:hypothetical protein [Burkholderia oklahomensis]|uniref:hypothetical protein n=1 Tax=Burkholderia oklahomensis TaxID=342113 RepID=UPI00059ED749|nr:hypothetical protein [Burkholderia oklahomensis]AOI39249.1 hypothetical protein WG70_06190 [Burkholderia oklahomensis EO147]KUY51739.1 hypothetical protein WG70_15745 [Burkholderia oklahomensis EO147]QPS41847.1 hypothetical protein I6G57_32170 [Burkholderia oklahomensis]